MKILVFSKITDWGGGELLKAQSTLACVSQSLQEDRSEDLIAVDLNSALEHLGGILGKTFVDDLLDQIFVDFCIGK